MSHLARTSDPLTSHLAAARTHDFQHSHQSRIHAVLVEHGPMGAEEIERFTDIPAYSIRKRLPELARLNKAATTGRLLVTSSGRHEREWAAS